VEFVGDRQEVPEMAEFDVVIHMRSI
jgi:hypothetical protein